MRLRQAGRRRACPWRRPCLGTLRPTHPSARPATGSPAAANRCRYVLRAFAVLSARTGLPVAIFDCEQHKWGKPAFATSREAASTALHGRDTTMQGRQDVTEATVNSNPAAL